MNSSKKQLEIERENIEHLKTLLPVYQFYSLDQVEDLLKTCESLLTEVQALEIVKLEMHNYRDKWLNLQKELEKIRTDNFPESRWREKYYDKCAELNEAESKLTVAYEALQSIAGIGVEDMEQKIKGAKRAALISVIDTDTQVVTEALTFLSKKLE